MESTVQTQVSKIKADSFIEGMGRHFINHPETQEWCQAGMLLCLSLNDPGHHNVSSL